MGRLPHDTQGRELHLDVNFGSQNGRDEAQHFLVHRKKHSVKGDDLRVRKDQLPY